MKIACLTFTDSGDRIGDRLQSIKNKDYKIYHYSNREISGGIKNILEYIWNQYDGLVFISATGIAMRMSAKYIKDKRIDPAVVVVDDLGKFSISLLSGHIGGANALARYIADQIDALPIITTATDNRDIESVDMFANSNDYYIEDIKSITKITSMMVNGKTIGLYTEERKSIKYKNTIIIESLKNIDPRIEGIIIVSSQEKIDNIPIPFVVLRPKNINLGIGCRKGIKSTKIINAILELFKVYNLSINSIKSIGTVEAKKDEKGIIDTSLYFDCPLEIFCIDEIRKVEDGFIKSQFVKDTIGVYSVSGPVAYLLGGKMIVEKSKQCGITISVAKEKGNG